MLDLMVADVDGDAVPEIFVLESLSFSGRIVKRFDRTLRPVSSFAVPDYTHSLHLEELPGGRKNLLLGMMVGGDHHLRAADPVTGAEIWRSPRLPGEVAKNSVRYLDVFPSTGPEIVYATRRGMNVTR